MGWDSNQLGLDMNPIPRVLISSIFAEVFVWKAAFAAAHAPFKDTGAGMERTRHSGVCFSRIATKRIEP